jgi:hypothetical protein
MMTIREVPTKTPMPMVEISRSWLDERVIDNGSAPARKQLRRRLAEDSSVWQWDTHVNAMTTLSASSMNNPSNILMVLCRNGDRMLDQVAAELSIHCALERSLSWGF